MSPYSNEKVLETIASNHELSHSNSSSSSIKEHSSEEKVSSFTSSVELDSDRDVDVAAKFLRENKDERISMSEDNNDSEGAIFYGSHELPKKTLRKLDMFVLPFLCMTYLLMFLDKALLNYAASMGIKDHLKGNDFANLSTIFGASYIFMEPLVTYLIQRYPISKILGAFIMTWGAVLACHCACKSYASLMIVRTLLGMFESSSAVGCIAISGMYYTKAEQSARIGFWATQAGTGYIVGGLISFGFQHYHGKDFTSWQIMFLVVGLFTVAFGLLTFFYLPDNVTNAWFLNKEEKLQVVEHIRSNQTGLETKKFKMSQVKELFLKDKLTWPMLFITTASQICTGAIGTFSVTITATFGFDSYETALLQLPIGAITAMIIIITTQMISRWGNITLITTSMYIPAIIGAIVLISLPLSHKVGNLLSLYLLYSGSCVITNIYIWNSCNTSGYTKRVFRNAITMIFYNVACIIAPQMFRANQAPRYVPAKIGLLVTQCVCIPAQLYVGYLCKKENQQRDKEQEGQKKEKYQFLDMTDIENRNFRYIY
ncbi:similar to Saccharomyces cerevisiae YLR004C THI73 Putative plasma membrane permease proposed to be involved in carboxylic acid uptake and repressed by thiamine [Maudiozyma barnettii]|uniref:Similar to Saccharomyces cerevisiae YLR004C THI73 Putative plasma membrane permease proposed to be involved in carboxylic acid uptake and repressed by thiamine n=1 Tax=Maudiozyma barnettii TaxID=61262 RepID=A0A8H2VBA5_9SACH|nr:Thi73p [Kazachstania barnettii]CAB4252122.1 similar to Saccharomyces cerevisiae YLR004C THI73 Putative plasma membrane permease proposed to be involved in carboxylic acid uptake and repressed by thiamine [Kazachstania barnettii]CAD1778661.1 similar to Saccharomyces cerevisiae YLR004C THI73 Putative plasma membrane permease proposed to be involved in carboxylic acid uptake and repressed by thiamine [Kazachstania barnettii]